MLAFDATATDKVFRAWDGQSHGRQRFRLAAQ